MTAPHPSVHQQYYQGISKKGPVDIHQTQHMLRAIMKTIHEDLHTISMNFLKSGAVSV
jgi:hypothetical protein